VSRMRVALVTAAGSTTIALIVLAPIGVVATVLGMFVAFRWRHSSSWIGASSEEVMRGPGDTTARCAVTGRRSARCWCQEVRRH